MVPNYKLLVRIFYALNTVKCVHTWKLDYNQLANIVSVLYPFLYNQQDMDDVTWKRLFDVGLRKAGSDIKITDKHVKTFRSIYDEV